MADKDEIRFDDVKRMFDAIDPVPSEDEKSICQLCGKPMPPGEEMFMYHGYSGPCPT